MAPSRKSQDTAERRQVTVMFSDLSAQRHCRRAWTRRILREVISAYQQCVAKTVQRLGGFVAKYMGDGVLVYFGYPHAHEDDAERAVRAGLELIAAVTALKASAPLQTRVGIATGLVVVGDLIGSGEAQERGIVGETPNLAARLQGIADPNTVVIAEATRKLLGSLFELDEVGPKDLKGIAGPVRAFVALRPRSVESRFEALHASVLTELVGREEELELLLRRWARAMNGEGQVVLLSGEPGIGKSRLTAALLERLAGEPHTRLRYFCSPQATDSALFPVIGQMERAAGFAYDDDAEAKLDKLEALASPAASPEDVALLAELLSLPTVRYPASTASPQRKKEQTFTAPAAATGGAGPLSAGIDVVRGPALDRPQLARTARPDDRACGAAAIAAGADLSAGIPGPLDRAVTRDFADPEPARPAERRGDGFVHRRRARVARGAGGEDCRARRRRAVVRRGTGARRDRGAGQPRRRRARVVSDRAGGGRGAGGIARLVDGAARPARPDGARSRADRRRNRPRLRV